MSLAAASGEFSAGHWAASIGVLAAIVPLAVVGLRQMWRADRRWAEPPSWWVSGRGQWYGFIRSAPSAVVVAASASAAPLASMFDKDGTAFAIVLFVLLAGLFGGMLTMTTTAFANWPKALVPPPRRNDRPALRRLFSRPGRAA